MSGLITFREVEVSDAETILNWRSSPRVTRFMKTDVNNSLEDQKKWILSCESKKDYYHWIVNLDGQPVGLVNITDFSESDSSTSWGYYVGEDNATAYGGFIPPYIYNFLFNKIGINKVNIEVFFNNQNVIGLNQLHGFRFVPENDKVICKAGKEILLIAMSLNKSEWKVNRYKKYNADFPVKKWKFAPDHLKI